MFTLDFRTEQKKTSKSRNITEDTLETYEKNYEETDEEYVKKK